MGNYSLLSLSRQAEIVAALHHEAKISDNLNRLKCQANNSLSNMVHRVKRVSNCESFGRLLNACDPVHPVFGKRATPVRRVSTPRSSHTRTGAAEISRTVLVTIVRGWHAPAVVDESINGHLCRSGKRIQQ